MKSSGRKGIGWMLATTAGVIISLLWLITGIAPSGTATTQAHALGGWIAPSIPDDPRFERGLPPDEQQQREADWDQPQRVPVDQLIGRGNRPEVITSGNWTNIAPQLVAIDAVSSTDAWALVEGGSGSLLHYTGGSWQPASIGNSWYVYDIDMLSSTSGWIAANYSSDRAALEYDGTNWIEHSSGNLFLNRVSAVGDDDVWFVGRDTSAGYIPVIAHWDGASFVSAGPSLPSSTYFYDIQMSSSTEGWVVGDNYDSQTGTDTPVVLRYDGATWSSVPPPMSTGYLTEVASTGPGVMWAAGVDYSDYYSRVYRYSGGVWTSWILPGSGSVSDLFMINANEGYVARYGSIVRWDGGLWTQEYTGQQFFGVSGVSGQVWAVGGGEFIMSRTGAGSWVKQNGGPTSHHIRAVSSLSVDDAWAVGSSTNGAQGTTIVHYSGGAWQPVTNTLTGTLYDVQMLSTTEGYAVGSSTIASWDGTSWARTAQPGATLYGLAMTGPGQGWAVGSSGQIWRATGGTWLQVSSPVTTTLYAVAMESPSHGWAVGYRYVAPSYVSTLLEYDGSSWIDRSNLVPPSIKRLLDIVLDGAGNGWAVGDAYSSNTYSIMRLSNGVWSADTNTDYTYMFSVANEALGEAWAVGCNALHYVGGSWDYTNLPTNWCQYGVSLVPGRGGWAVGPYGGLIKYTPLAAGQRYYDVPLDNTFYSFIECMATRGIISGYGDNTFRPNNEVTRGQLSKIVSNSAGFTEDPGEQRFEDVPPTNTFYEWIQRLASRGHIGGYECGGVGEPCISGKPYFRPNANATRAQISKIVSNAAQYNDPPGEQIFEDVPPTHTFYEWIQRLASRNIMSGYSCGGTGEPCISGKPYFRPQNNATRGQTSKIVSNTFFPECQALVP